MRDHLTSRSLRKRGGRSPLACWCFADCSSSAAQASAAQAEQQDQMNGSMLIRFLELLAVVAFASNTSLHDSNAVARSVATLLAKHLKTLELLSSITPYLLTCDCQNR